MKFKRVLAYIVDSIVVSLIVSLISMIGFLNPTIEKYNKTYEEYQQFNNDILASEEEINTKELMEKSSEYYYKLQKYSLSTNIIEIFCLIGYFVIFNITTQGQTLGKKLFKIKIVPNKCKINWKNYLLRMLILNSTWITILTCILLFVLPAYNFYITSMIITYLGYAVLIVDVLMMLFRRDERSLHDILSNTKVVEA